MRAIAITLLLSSMLAACGGQAPQGGFAPGPQFAAAAEKQGDDEALRLLAQARKYAGIPSYDVPVKAKQWKRADDLFRKAAGTAVSARVTARVAQEAGTNDYFHIEAAIAAMDKAVSRIKSDEDAAFVREAATTVRDVNDRIGIPQLVKAMERVLDSLKATAS